MRIPEEKIDEIKNSVDIVDVISRYVPLKKQGTNYKGVCPFHQEKTPSFVVSPSKGIYHCFGCHKGGNVFSFLMDYRNVTFIEAVEEIADISGIKLDEYKSKTGDTGYSEEIESMFEINNIALNFFKENLLNNESDSLEYLESRSINEKTLKEFNLGFAPDSWDSFYKLLSTKKLKLEYAEHLGLIQKKENGGYYDKYRKRVIFPIYTLTGRIAGFGGRIIEKNDKAPKYLNSPESKIYSKRKILYGLYHSKEEIRKLDYVFLVEGYMDVISLHQSGIRNVVASSGTSLTEEQIVLLSRFTNNIKVLFDSDSAGENATIKSIELLIQNKFEIKVVSLPKGEDPDSFIKNFGKNEFIKLADKAENFLEYKLKRYKEQGVLDDVNKSAAAVKETVKLISYIDDDIKRALLLKDLSKKFDLSLGLLDFEMEKLKPNKKTEVKKNLLSNNSAKNDDEKKILRNSLENELIKLIYSNDIRILDLIFDNFMPEDFESDLMRKLAMVSLEYYKKGIVSPSDIINRIEDERTKKAISYFSSQEIGISQKKWDELMEEDRLKESILKKASDIIGNIKVNRIDFEISEKLSYLEAADDEEQKILMLDIESLKKERIDILKKIKAG